MNSNMSRRPMPLERTASEVEDERIMSHFRSKLDAQGHSCSNCDSPGALIPCMDRCGESYYCSNECVVQDAKRHRDNDLNMRLSDDQEDDDDGDGAIDNGDLEDDEDPDRQDDDATDDSDCPVDEEISFVDHFCASSVTVERGLERVESIEVTCLHCSETAVITRSVLNHPETKQKASTTCICGEVVGFWV
ncbi:hypothetical protein Ae201684P_011528 [Aphanomyces euteiches]|nr:hypothetical protein Ae201684P_011528 [Aphanomyces euteiches]